MTQKKLRYAIVTDQLLAVRKTVAISIPVNILLGVASLLVAHHAGETTLGAIWFTISSIVNAMRIILCRLPIRQENKRGSAFGKLYPLSVQHHLLLHTLFAFLSGMVWAFIPVLCNWYTSPQTLFYLTVVCGITAGAVTHGFAYARIPIFFITPSLLSVAICLIAAGGFDRMILALTVLLYLAALIRSSRLSEKLVINDSRLKNEATALSRSLEVANEQQRLVAEQMQQRAVHDQLTGLLNRSGFAEALERAAEGGKEGCLMLFDLDGFKSVNDAYGHKTGDRVLVEVARRLTEVMDKDATVARLGGDEYAIYLGTLPSHQEAEILATRLITAISIPFSKLDAGRVGASVGIYIGKISDMDELMIYADAALYAAKKEGRNRFRIFDDALRMEAQISRDVERDLAQALSKETLEIWFQPVMADDGKRVDTFEALLRWKHAQHGWITPSTIIDTAAITGLSEPLFRFIAREAAIMALSLKSIGRGNIKIAFNVSPRELAQIAVDELLLAKLERMGVSPSAIVLEITEEGAINPRLIQHKLTRLASSGVRLAIDDFGIGYSSLGSLQQIPASRVKIDKSLVTGTTLTSTNRSLIDAVLRVSEAYGFDVVVEGVETESDFWTMQQLGCKLMQGFYFSGAMPRDKAIAWLDGIKKDIGQPLAP
ncbi:putative bifunctional diguanylate cyclase/phosphodiesterase [Oryzifoliimicrobium ureilyticus]|uniref:putative bifunctional diguanylate cyclase/phosphodiesterase n=1 Tax=Oryzifoliimicrobium ureilyticus TaxID=3113724 RepID=UPI00307679B6